MENGGLAVVDFPSARRTHIRILFHRRGQYHARSSPLRDSGPLYDQDHQVAAYKSRPQRSIRDAHEIVERTIVCPPGGASCIENFPGHAVAKADTHTVWRKNNNHNKKTPNEDKLREKGREREEGTCAPKRKKKQKHERAKWGQGGGRFPKTHRKEKRRESGVGAKKKAKLCRINRRSWHGTARS